MQPYEKIKNLMDQKGLSVVELHRQIRAQYGRKSISYLTLYRTVNGLTKVRDSTLGQVAETLGIPVKEIKKGAGQEDNHIRYDYDDKKEIYFEANDCDIMFAENKKKMPFLAGRLVIRPKGKTTIEQDPPGREPFFKWIYGLRGEVTCVIETNQGWERKSVKCGECFAFNSTLRHYFENNKKFKVMCIVLQCPKYL